MMAGVYRIALGMAAVAVGSVFMSCAASQDDGADGIVPLLTQDTFKESLDKKPQFVMFFAPW